MSPSARVLPHAMSIYDNVNGLKALALSRLYVCYETVGHQWRTNES